ncbi:MAG: hypothetical protein EOM83_05390 [Clostridia bacterium]|nr:hypothetical protein [Clostridia bacterium]
MKILFLNILLFAMAFLGFTQNHNNSTGFLVTDFRWDVTRNDTMATMQMDVPFDSQRATFDTILLIVEKRHQQERPARIRLQVPAGIERNIGVMINFGKNVKKQYGNSSELSGERMMAPISVCEGRVCFVDFPEGYFMNNGAGTKTDLIARFDEFDTIHIFFMYPDGRQANLMIPLDSFRKSYVEL